MKFTSVAYSVECPAPQKLFAMIKSERIEARGISQKEDKTLLSVSVFQKRRFERICRELGAEYAVLSEGKALGLMRSAFSRIGLIAGAAICAVGMAVMQNYVVSIEVLTDDEDIRRDVTSLLNDCGIRSLTYIPSIDCVNAERALKQKVDGISWAGITLTDSTVIVDVIENIPEPQKHYERMPSNLIATHDAVIEDVELYNGRLVKTVGSGVLRGETLVSGTVIKEETTVKEGELVTEQSEKYVRSVGKVFGTYTDVQVFEQPLSDTKIVKSGKTVSKKYLSLFDTEIPLFFKPVKGFYTEEETYSPLEVLGEETPVGLRSVTYEKYSFENVIYTREQAEKLADQARQNYEINFLSDCEIRLRKTDFKLEDDKVILTVTYEIYGQISEESQFFIKK